MRVGIGRGAAVAVVAAVAIATGAGAASAATSAPPQEQPAKMIAGDSRWLVFNQTNSDIQLYDSSKWDHRQLLLDASVRMDPRRSGQQVGEPT